MAGHNKWSKIKNKKGKEDKKRGKMFTKLGRAIVVAVKEGGDNPEYNSALQTAIDNARSYNMPNKNIERAIKSASTNLSSNNFEKVIYEGYGPSGIAVVVECLTDNRNRTAPEIRHAFDKSGGNLGTDGSVVFMFDKRGVIIVNNESQNTEKIMEEAIEKEALDIKIEDEVSEIYTSIENFIDTKDYFKNKEYKIEEASIMYIPTIYQDLTDKDDIEKMNQLIDTLEDNDDVQAIYYNWGNEEDEE